MTQATSGGGFPTVKGIQLIKEVHVLNMLQQSAARGLSKLWSDTFLTNAGIDAGNSSNYTYRGSANYDVIANLVAADITAGQTFTASATYGSDGPSKAFDDNASTYWNPVNAKTVPQWIKVQFSVAKTIQKITLNFLDSATYTYTVDGSNNDTDWTTLLTITTKAYTGGTPGTETFANSTAYLYYRVNITAQTGGTFLCIKELEMMEAAPTTAIVQSVRALNLASNITNVVVFASYTGTAPVISVSTDDGSNWLSVPTLEQIQAVTAGKQIKLKAALASDTVLTDWGIAA